MTATRAEIYIDTNAQGGSTYAAAIGSMGADGTLSQTIATTAGQTYTLSFWLQNEGSTGNDFKAIWNGQTLLSLTNAGQFGYTRIYLHPDCHEQHDDVWNFPQRITQAIGILTISR